jgi:hypothetical protein
MSTTKPRALDYMELEWGTYVERFNRLPKEAQNKRVQEMDISPFAPCWRISLRGGRQA